MCLCCIHIDDTGPLPTGYTLYLMLDQTNVRARTHFDAPKTTNNRIYNRKQNWKINYSLSPFPETQRSWCPNHRSDPFLVSIEMCFLTLTSNKTKWERIEHRQTTRKSIKVYHVRLTLRATRLSCATIVRRKVQIIFTNKLLDQCADKY